MAFIETLFRADALAYGRVEDWVRLKFLQGRSSASGTDGLMVSRGVRPELEADG